MAGLTAWLKEKRSSRERPVTSIVVVAAVPAGDCLYRKLRDRGQDEVCLRAAHNGAHANLSAMFRRDHDHHRTHRQLQDIILPRHAVYLLLHDALYNAGPMHGMDYLIPDLKQNGYTSCFRFLIPRFLFSGPKCPIITIA